MFLALFSFLVAFLQISATSCVSEISSRQIIFSNEADKENLLPAESSTPLVFTQVGPSSVLPDIVQKEEQDEATYFEDFERSFCFYRKTAKELQAIEGKLDYNPEDPILCNRHYHLCCVLFDLTTSLLLHRHVGLERLKAYYRNQAILTQAKLEEYDRRQNRRRRTIDLARVAILNNLNLKIVHILNFILHLQHWWNYITVDGMTDFHEAWEPFLL